MDIERVKRLRRSLTMHFGVIAWLTAMLVASGSQSYFLPILIFCVALSAYVFVDTLEWFEVGRWGSYFLMTVSTTIALANYVYYALYSPSEAGQLMAVASLLVFPEAVLLLQRKNLRVYEQLAVFLLLEMVVAALVNDNIVFGILLAPIMLLWVSSLFLFARYATLVYIDSSIERPIPHLAELLYAKLRRRGRRGEGETPTIESKVVTARNVQGSRLARRLLQSIPIGIGAIAFAGFFFYLMPRTSPGSLRQSLGSGIRVGLPGEVTLGTVGRLKSDPSPVMRVTLRHDGSRRQYRVFQAPYLRAGVLDTYLASSPEHYAIPGKWIYGGAKELHALSGSSSVDELEGLGRDLVSVEFDIRRRYLPTLFCMHAPYATKRAAGFNPQLDRFNATLNGLSPENAPQGSSVVYELGTASFANGRQLRVQPVDYPDPRRLFQLSRMNDDRIQRNGARLLAVGSGFRRTKAYAENVLSAANCLPEDTYRAASLIEKHFVQSGEFKYSLDLTLPEDPNLDPIEDFVVNKRAGHCQYFASAMVVMLRNVGIPARLVIGYHPREFNRRGEYFAVRQSDAHAWVEARVSRENLVGTEHEKWLSSAEQYWVRFDPTPASDELGDEIIDQPGQAFDFAEKLWKDYVVDGQKLDSKNGLYAPVAANGKSAMAELIKSINSLRDSLKADGLGSRATVLWPLVVMAVLMLLLGLALWRLVHLLPRFAPKLARRLGVGGSAGSYQQAFYGKCLAMLEGAGLKRDASQAPGEFATLAGRQLNGMRSAGPESPASDPAGSLGVLTDHYCRERFGGHETSGDGKQQIESALLDIERAVGKQGRKRS